MINEALNITLMSLYKDANISILNKLFKALVKHGYSIQKLDSRDIEKVTPRQSMSFGGEIGDKYCKIWVQPSGRIAFCTWANTMIDGNFRWNSKAFDKSERRDYKDIIGTKECISEYLKKTSWVYDSRNIEYVLMMPFAKMGDLNFIKHQRERNFTIPKNVKDAALKISIDEIFKEFGINQNFKVTMTSMWLDRTEKEYEKKTYDRKLESYLDKTTENILRRLYAAKNMFQNGQQIYNSITDKFYDFEIKVHSLSWPKLENFSGPKGLYNKNMYKGYPKYYVYEFRGEFPSISVKYDGQWVKVLEVRFAEQKDVYSGKKLISIYGLPNYKRYIPVL